MKLTAEDHAKLETKQLANIIRKLHDGKTLTAREEATLARHKASPPAGVQTPAPTPLPSAFAQNFDQLADALGVSRKSLQNWRARPDLLGKFPKEKADGRHDIAAWSRFMVEHGLARADEDAEVGDGAGDKPRTVTEWKQRREELLCTKLEREIEKDDGKLLVAAELEVPLGATFAAIQTKLSQFPARVARFLVGLRDEQELEGRLREEIDADLADLQAAHYASRAVAEVLAEFPFDAESEQMFTAVAFAGQDRALLLRLIGHVAEETLRRIGRSALRGARKEHDGSAAVVSDAITGQVTPEAEDRSSAQRQAIANGHAEPAIPSVPDSEPQHTDRIPDPPASGKTARGGRGPSGGKKRARKTRRQPTPPPPDVEGAILTTPAKRRR